MSHDEMVKLEHQFPRSILVEEVRKRLEQARGIIRDRNFNPRTLTPDDIVADVVETVDVNWQISPKRVVNGTGIILHTNLGRAPLSEDAARAAEHAALGYSDTEYDLTTAGRGSRHTHVASLLQAVTGAEAGIAVNNNAAAALLALSTLAGDGGDVIVSRSEAVEIGGGFRVPDVMAQSGANLIDVGTTNRTYARDYEAAIGPNTRAILKVHRSNFKISGFVHEDPISDIVDIANRHRVPVIHDLGSGCLIDTAQFGLEPEPTVQESVRAGSHLTLFSGDKMMGGPQAGIIVGHADLVKRVSIHPLARAVRIDKMTLAALNATLLSYVRGAALQDLPVLQMMSTSIDELQGVAELWAREVGAEIVGAKIVGGRTAIGGGSAPEETLPSKRLKITLNIAPHAIAARLRKAEKPIIGRIEDDSFFLDTRTVLPKERDYVARVLRSLSN